MKDLTWLKLSLFTLLCFPFSDASGQGEIDCSDPQNCYGCSMPGALNYDPDVEIGVNSYCYFLEMDANETIAICSGSSVRIGGIPFGDFLLCEDLSDPSAAIEILPNVGVSEPFFYETENVSSVNGAYANFWLVSPSENTTYELVSYNNAACEAEVIYSYEVIVLDDCDCEDPGSCNDGDLSNGFEYWDATTCACLTYETNCGCGIVGATNYDSSIDCMDIDLCQFETFVEGVPVCLNEGAIHGPFDINLVDECDTGLWEIIPSDGVFTIENFQGSGEGVLHFYLNPQSTTTYTFNHFVQVFCEGEPQVFEALVIDCSTGIADHELGGSLDVTYNGRTSIRFQLNGGFNEPVRYKIFDLNGRLFESARTESSSWELSVANIPPGVYLIQGGFGVERFLVF